MASFAEEFYKKNNFMCRRLNIILINAAEEILSGLDPWLVKKSAKRLEKLGVKTYHKTKVTAITQESVTLSSGERLPIDFMVFAGGIEPNALVHALDVAKNEKGYIVTNEYLQLPQYKEVFAIGDCTTIYENQTPIAPTADVAEQMAEHCALNIENQLKNRALKPHSIKSRGVLIALGRRYGAIKIFGFYLSGYLAFIIKKTVEKLYFKNLDARSHRGCKKIFS
jgi:NADH dehydrogenase